MLDRAVSYSGDGEDSNKFPPFSRTFSWSGPFLGLPPTRLGLVGREDGSGPGRPAVLRSLPTPDVE